MEDLKTYFFALSPEGREAFASLCGTTSGHLRNCAYGYRVPATEVAVAIEKHSGGKVTRRSMFPKTYLALWPELAEAKAA